MILKRSGHDLRSACTASVHEHYDRQVDKSDLDGSDLDSSGMDVGLNSAGLSEGNDFSGMDTQMDWSDTNPEQDTNDLDVPPKPELQTPALS